MIQIINCLEAQIPGFNRQPFTWDDFYALAEREKIEVVFWDFPDGIRGFYYRDHQDTAIGISRQLIDVGAQIIAWHEMGHHFLSHGNCFYLRDSTYLIRGKEHQARIFAALALCPTPILEQQGDELLAPWPLGFREFRWRVYQTWLNSHCRTSGLLPANYSREVLP